MSDHVTVNRDYWNGMAADWVAGGERAWASDQVTWGNWGAPEAELRLLPGDMTGMDAIELGCGTGYVSAWMARRGARVTGIDVSAEQLATARRLNDEHGLDITFLEGNAEATGLPDGILRFRHFRIRRRDLVRPRPLAARGAPPAAARRHAGVPRQPPHDHHHHAAERRALRPGAAPALPRPDRRRLDGGGNRPGGIEFNRTISGWMALFDAVGFDILRYQELFRAGRDAEGTGIPSPSPGPRISRPNRSGRCAAGDRRTLLRRIRGGAYISD
jgi:SAM-dependent methyltransferase